MKEIGGYFELELNKTGEYYPSAIKVNSGRNAIKYILQAKNIKKVYIPYFTCKTVLEPINILNISYEFYRINEHFELLDITSNDIKDDEKLIYINYFGIKNNYVDNLAKIFDNKLIVDNTQAFFKKPLTNIDTCYSPRKFFGVPDGGYIFTDTYIKKELRQDVSFKHSSHLIERFEGNASEFYSDFINNKKALHLRPIMKMSNFTHNILTSIDYEKIRLIRERNFCYLHVHLKDINKLEIDLSNIVGPMTYPILIEIEGLREYLIRKKVYIPTYWIEVLEYVNEPDCFEAGLAQKLLPLPIDQRYELSDMKIIIDFIILFINKDKQ